MQEYPGAFIVLEGSDGSGKGTQFRLLHERLKAVGYDVETFDFPRYEEGSSHFVRRYLNGDYGPASDVSPYSASLFYALDRFEAAPAIRKALKEGKVVLSNRYVGSNMAHQGSKFTNPAEQRGFFIWADSLEYQLLGIPRPTINLFLRVPAEVSYDLIDQKNQRSYTDKKHDEHEADINHLRRSVQTYDTLCQLFPKDFLAIECTADGKLMSIPAVSDSIWQVIQYILPAKPQREPRETVVNLEQKPTPAKEEKPAPQAPATATKQAKVSLLGYIELAKSGVITAEGLEMGARQPDYYVPNLPPDSLKKYHAYMKDLADYRHKLDESLTKHKVAGKDEVLDLLIPMATLCYVPQPSEGDRIKEPKLAGQGNAARKQLEKLVGDQTAPTISTNLDAVTLLDVQPRNEFELLSDSLYDVSDLPRQQVQAGIENWSYEQKYQALSAVLADIDPSVAEQVRYRWDIIAEQGLLMELLLSGLAASLQLQAPTPRYGYDIPPAVEEAGLEGEFIDCFDLSLEAYSALQAGKDPDLAAYATLTGHKIRFQFSCDLASLKKLPEVRSKLLDNLLKQLIDSISQNQPIIAEHLKRQLEPKPKTTKKPRHRSRRRSSK